MVSYPLIRVLTNPYQLVTLLLGVAACLLTLTTLPPSSVIYLIRADYRSNGDAAATQTAWLGTLGYCATDASNEILHSSNIKCSGAVVGYDMTKALEQIGGEVGIIPEASISSISLTKGSVVLNPIAIALCLLSIAAFQAIRCRPKGLIYAVAMGCNMLALLISGIAFIFEYSLIPFIAGGFLAADATLTTTSGPLIYAIVLALGLQLAACVVGFYTCIGGKYDCEGGIRLEEVESNLDFSYSTIDCQSPPDEKCPL
ncbi:hypothetical protein EV127DRAFT_446579 [Xylaria flabelliformis]|nr:hypothetical protein EV127DRAFT_446579 [Xylaria flabelliformis]